MTCSHMSYFFISKQLLWELFFRISNSNVKVYRKNIPGGATCCITSLKEATFTGFIFVQGGLASLYSMAYTYGYAQGKGRYHVNELVPCSLVTYDCLTDEDKIYVKNNSEGYAWVILVDFAGLNAFSLEAQ